MIISNTSTNLFATILKGSFTTVYICAMLWTMNVRTPKYCPVHCLQGWTLSFRGYQSNPVAPEDEVEECCWCLAPDWKGSLLAVKYGPQERHCATWHTSHWWIFQSENQSPWLDRVVPRSVHLHRTQHTPLQFESLRTNLS